MSLLLMALFSFYSKLENFRKKQNQCNEMANYDI